MATYTVEQASLRTDAQKVQAITRALEENKELAQRVAALEIVVRQLSNRISELQAASSPTD